MAMASPHDTGASNVEYDLISVMYHTLQGNEALTRYEQDATEAGDEEVTQFLREIREQNKQYLDRLRHLLSERLGR